MTSRTQPSGRDNPTWSTSISAKPFEIDSITDYMAPYIPSQQAALASLSLSASLLHSPTPAHLLASSYLLQRQRHYSGSAFAQLLTSLAHSSTLYIGNLSFTTREEQLLAAFHLPTLAYPTALHMGLNSLTKQPCGFAFLAFATPQQAHTTRAVLHALAVDERTVGIDMDQRFKPGREWGRGKSGGQIRDEVRQGWDAGRGGWGARERRQQQMREMKDQQKSTFKRMSEGDGEEQREAEDEATGQQQRAKREHGSYAHAQAMRRAGAQQAKATEAETAGAEAEAEAEGEFEEADRASKRQKLEAESKQQDDDTQHTTASELGDSNQQEDEEQPGAVYWADGEPGDGMEEEKQVEDAAVAEEEEEVEHGFGGGDEETDEPQWT